MNMMVADDDAGDGDDGDDHDNVKKAGRVMGA